jgi:hypothetical protein
MIISTMTIMELSIAVVGILGAVGGVIKASSCQKVKCLWGGLECDKTPLETEGVKVVPPDIELVKIEKKKD